MRRVLAFTLAIAVWPAAAFGSGPPRVFSLNPNVVRALRDRISAEHFNDPALARLRADADRAMQLPALSVVQKEGVPPSGDKHDYMSLAPYWWPNPNTRDGLPYIRHDGERNPEINKFEDHKHFGELTSAVRTLGLAYYLFSDESYAGKATELLRAWFMDPKTRMNPNLQYAQAVRGVNLGRGTGLIETRGITSVIDAVGLLAGSRAWTATDQKTMQSWCASFLDWMLHSDNGKAESRARNNHGSSYDVQVVSLALFTGNTVVAGRVLRDACRKRIETQIEPDGREPLELARTKSLSYSTFNLTALFTLAELGERAGVDLWYCQAPNGASIRKALEFLMPYASGVRPWPYKQIEHFNGSEIAPLFLTAATIYANPEYGKMALEIDPQLVHRLDYVMAEKASSGNSRHSGDGRN